MIDDIFKKELFDLEKARYVCSRGKYERNELFADYLDLIARYEKLLETMMTLTRISDSQQVYLQETQEELRKALKLLENEMAERKEELKVARLVQKSMIPASFPAPHPLKIRAVLKPVAEVSGDYYDIFMIDDRRVGILVADVCGHGVPSAFVTAMAKFTFINESKTRRDTGEVCEAVNRALVDALSDCGFFLTAFFLVLDTADLTAAYTNAGHHKAFVLKHSAGSLDEIDSRGSLIGIARDMRYGSGALDLARGDRIVMFTDGIVEARNRRGESYETSRLAALILEHREMEIGGFCDFIMKDVERFCEGVPIDDDRTILAVEILEGDGNEERN